MIANHAHILADGRWQGQHGIGRFASEVLSRLKNADILTKGPKPLSIKNLFWQSYVLSRHQPYQVFFNPGFNPVCLSSIPFTFTIHDLIHLNFQSANILIKNYFEYLIKPAAKRAHKIFTVSTYSKNTILNWTNLAPAQVIVVGSGVSQQFNVHGTRFEPEFPYLLHVGNCKPHKNIERLIKAFAQAEIDRDIKLILTGELTRKQQQLIQQLHLSHRIINRTQLSEKTLAEYYRGALGVVFPSLYEGFGLPVIEGMASGVPVLTSTVTSLPEIAENAAILVNPHEEDAIADGITQLVNDSTLRIQLIQRGLNRCKVFSWDKTAAIIQQHLDHL